MDKTPLDNSGVNLDSPIHSNEENLNETIKRSIYRALDQVTEWAKIKGVASGFQAASNQTHETLEEVMSGDKPVMPSNAFLFQLLEGNKGTVSKDGNAVTNEIQLPDGTSVGARFRPSKSTGSAGDVWFGDMSRSHADSD